MRWGRCAAALLRPVRAVYWTGVPVHEYDVIMPGGMSYGLRTASCGTVLPGKGVRYLGNAAINQRTAVLRQRREIAILTVRVDTSTTSADRLGLRALGGGALCPII